MNVISKNELAKKYNMHIRSVCYHLKIANGLVGYSVKMGRFKVGKEMYELPKRLDKRTKIVFVVSEVDDYFNNDNEGNTRF